MHRLFLELLPGGAPVKKSTAQYKALLARVRPRDLAGKTRRRMAAEELADLDRHDAKLKVMKAELKAAVQARGSRLMDIHGIGPAGAARILADVGDVARFPDRNHFASWTGTAPIEGEEVTAMSPRPHRSSATPGVPALPVTVNIRSAADWRPGQPRSRRSHSRVSPSAIASRVSGTQGCAARGRSSSPRRGRRSRWPSRWSTRSRTGSSRSAGRTRRVRSPGRATRSW